MSCRKIISSINLTTCGCLPIKTRSIPRSKTCFIVFIKFLGIVPFTTAIINKNFEILNIFTKNYAPHFKINTQDNLQIISDMNDDEINNYFMKIPNFIEYVVISEFDNIIPEDLKIIFFLR